MVLMASLCYAELASMMPSAGGEYDYIQRAYGKAASFVCAWYYFWVKQPSSVAIVATVFGNYIVTLFTGSLHDTKEDTAESKIAALLLIAVLTVINCLRVQQSAYLNAVFSAAKAIMLLSVLICALVYVAQGSTDTIR